MNTPTSTPTTATASRRGPSRLKLIFWLLIVPLVLIAAYFAVVLSWNYSSGERAGWVQKFSRKGWLCKTWEGEMALVTMPGAIPEKFLFTVWDDKVAEQINRVVGKRVTLHYEERVGLPTTCFGETRHFVSKVAAIDENPLAPSVAVPAPGQPPQASPVTPPAGAASTPAPAAPTPAPASEYTLPSTTEASPSAATPPAASK
jgi:hypothetical protein